MGCFATEENTEDDNPPIGINYSRRRFKMKSVTRYFRNAVAASMQGTVNYKKERFFVVTEGELLSGKLSEENNFNIWKKEYDAESDNDEEKLKIKNVIIALKTLATEFRDGGKMEDNIEEMTSFFFLPLCVTRTGKLCMPVEGKIPWIPREYLRPMEDPLLAVGDGEKYDEFLEHTTNERYQLDSWQDYLAYAIKLYEFVAEIPFKSNYIRRVPYRRGKNCGRIVEKNGVCGRGGTMLRNMINNIKKSVCKANEDFIFGTDFADKMGWNELDDIRRTNGICDFF